MDSKNKLNDTYLPDKSTKAGKMVVALSGSLDSFVTAYLLKIQKYDLIGVTVHVGVEVAGATQEEIFSCSLTPGRLESIRQFCQQMNIPHHVVKAQSEFQFEVVDRWSASKLSGAYSEKCWDCHDLRLRLVYQKMKQLGVKTFATGHFAKIFKNEAHGTTYVHSSNDEDHDQSALLSRLPQEVLGAMALPLSDLQYKEVLKLAENFGLSEQKKIVQIHHCLPWNDETEKFLLSQVPERYLKDGEIMKADLTESLGNHEGVYKYEYGQFVKPQERSSEFRVSKYVFQEKKILVQDKKHFERKRFYLERVEVAQETNWSAPFQGVVQGRTGEVVECWVYPKPLKNALIECEGAIEIFERQIMTVFKKKGKNSKVYLTGKVKFIPETPAQETNEEKNETVDYSRDF